MTAILTQRSNNTGLSLAKELSPTVVDSSVAWNPQQPNSYKSFGASYTTKARTPINNSRQNRKGVLVDLSSGADWQEDLIYEATQNKIEGAMFANFRKKQETVATTVATSDDSYLATVTGWSAGDIAFVSGYTNAANNGVKHVIGASAGKITVAENLFDETGSTGQIVKVGCTCASADITYTAATFTLASTVRDFTTLGLIVGEFLFVGSDITANDLGSNLGFARISTIGPHAIVFDKVYPQDATLPIIDGAGTGKTVRLYFGRVIKNEQASGIQHITYQAERTLGKDDTGAADVQAEYVTGAMIEQVVFTFNSADKGTVDWTLMGQRYEVRSSATGKKLGTRPVLPESSAFNTSTDMALKSIEIVGSQTPLYAYLMNVAITIKNNAKAAKALGVLGAIDNTEGQFGISAAATAYFANVAAADAISSNRDVCMTLAVARDNHGILFDLPLVTLGDGQAKVTADEVIQLPLTVDAATAVSVNPNMDHTFMIIFFDYLPTVAMAS